MRFLFVDRIIQLIPGELTRGIKFITNDDFYLTLDSDNKACFIPSLIGETLGQLAAWNVMQHHHFTLRPVAGVVSCAQLHRPAYVGETLLLESVIENLDDTAVQYRSVARVGDELIFSLEGALGPLLPMSQFINSKVVKRQFVEINRPGDWNALGAVSSNSLMTQSEGWSSVSAVPMIFDTITQCEPGVSLTAEKRITLAASYFRDHFPRKPVLPMSVLLECKINLAQEFITRSGYSLDYQVSELRKIKMNDFILPGDLVVCQVKLKQQTEHTLILSFRSEVEQKRVCVVDVVLLSKGR